MADRVAPPGLAARIDHTLLDPAAQASDLARLCDEALEHGLLAVCVHPVWVAFCAPRVARAVIVCAVAGFPTGAHRTEVKALEVRRAVEEGAREVDMVAPLSALIAGDLAAVERDIAGVVEAAAGAKVKVILETSRLAEAAKEAGARCAVKAGAAFVKTSTGFAGGATVEDVRLLRAVVGPDFGVKAAGGIRTLAQAQAFLEAGADRLGTSASLAILKEAAALAGR